MIFFSKALLPHKQRPLQKTDVIPILEFLLDMFEGVSWNATNRLILNTRLNLERSHESCLLGGRPSYATAAHSSISFILKIPKPHLRLIVFGGF